MLMVLVLMTSTLGQPLRITTAEFDNEKACLTAANEIQQFASNKLSRGVWALCVKKGG